jgi:diguanylate cyclase (GGDEF)-like protein
MSTDPIESDTARVDGLVQVIDRLKQVIAEQREEIHRVSVTDELTGTLNRRGFVEAAGRLRAHLQRHGGSAHLLFIDVDGLKAVNDTHGREAGDDLIRRAAHSVTASIRDTDVIGRWGGDELVVYATSSDVETLSRRIADAAANNGASLSIGHVSFNQADRRTVDELIFAADSAMYVGRRQRRPAHSPYDLPNQRGPVRVR